MLLNVIPAQRFGEFSVSLAKQIALSNAPFFRPPPPLLLFPFCLPLSLSSTLSQSLIRRLMGGIRRDE